MIGKCIPKPGYVAEIKMPHYGSSSEVLVELVERTCSCVGCSKFDVPVDVHCVCLVLESFAGT